MALWLITLALTGALQTAPVNEIVAVVEGAPITLWDVEVEWRLASLVQRGAIPAGAPAIDDLKPALNELITQRLTLQAADRFRVSLPTEGDIEEELRSLKSPPENSPQTRPVVPVERQLAAAGIPESRLRLRLRAKLRVQRLLNERIREMVRVTDQDVRDYIERNPAEVKTYLEMHPQADLTANVREYLVTTRVLERSKQFYAELRERSAVDVLDPRFR